MGFKPTGGSSSARSIPTTLAEINVTPLVDVMLVLLIVFMISAPLMQQGVQVDLPKANTGAIAETPEQLVLTVHKSKQIYLANHLIPIEQLFKKIESIVGTKPHLEIVIQADQAVAYGLVAQIMADVKRAGVTRVGLITEPKDFKSSL
jgi:biopolymer transport protein TolR